eukprot:gnl/MRDRNA2_/MRDRNA2_84928_c0_seq2.p1 gnl/MRDRNA2_/MRDRNA2_84928_c0~~gnl/MRDRNA2_/MRDRNA2_84928_c0_seq2.p1  ORF type:complete len:575 (-),score=102.81 gnl/MRDRNA2_/MRDRNA2_84928_c0_seq2:102-1826(-)
MRASSIGLCFVGSLNGIVQGQLLRKLSGDFPIYEPVSSITSHSRIDLDQQEMEEHLSNSNFEAAKAIYTLGGNSGATALITVASLAGEAPSGAVVKQGNAAIGFMKKTAAGGATSIEVQYTSFCKDGGSATKDLSGCFTVEGGPLEIVGVFFSVGAPTKVQNMYRTLAGFSTQAQAKMEGQEFYKVYHDYYGAGDYAHSRVMAALDQTGFCSSCDATARQEMAKTTTVYMNVWMYVIHKMEDAILQCKRCLKTDKCKASVHAWDEAVAFYTGSLADSHDKSKPGKLLHELAEKLCKSFGTCTAGNGRSAVNLYIIEQFNKGQKKFIEGRCEEAISVKRRIVELMSVPLVQGALLSAYKVTNTSDPHGPSDKMPTNAYSHMTGSPVPTYCSSRGFCVKEKAEGEAFSAAILPRVGACGKGLMVESSIRENMDMNAEKPVVQGFAFVKFYFEQIYECLGITCEDVGGLVELGVEYFKLPLSHCPVPQSFKEMTHEQGAEGEEETSDPRPSTLVVVCIAVGGLMLASACAFVAWKCCKKGKRYSEFDGNTRNVDPVAVGRADLSEIHLQEKQMVSGA